MCDGGILDKSAALSDLFNQAAKTGLVAAKFDQLQIEVRLSNFYQARRLAYRSRRYPEWEMWQVMEDGLETGGHFDDAMTDLFRFGNNWDIKQAVNLEIDLWLGSNVRSAMETLHIIESI